MARPFPRPPPPGPPPWQHNPPGIEHTPLAVTVSIPTRADDLRVRCMMKRSACVRPSQHLLPIRELRASSTLGSAGWSQVQAPPRALHSRRQPARLQRLLRIPPAGPPAKVRLDACAVNVRVVGRQVLAHLQEEHAAAAAVGAAAGAAVRGGSKGGVKAAAAGTAPLLLLPPGPQRQGTELQCVARGRSNVAVSGRCA